MNALIHRFILMVLLLYFFLEVNGQGKHRFLYSSQTGGILMGTDMTIDPSGNIYSVGGN
ncbi:MAG: hypothetical protein IH946_02900, partial [Bacteroidetes bacterium]|nr:hypothetical protein [Bacteroidota bacterium]